MTPSLRLPLSDRYSIAARLWPDELPEDWRLANVYTTYLRTGQVSAVLDGFPPPELTRQEVERIRQEARPFLQQQGAAA